MKGDLFLDGKMFISSERAAKFGGYTKDYVGQLCRGGKLEARMVGRSWYVSIDSLVEHKKLNPEGKFWRRNKTTDKEKNQTTYKAETDKALTDLAFGTSPVLFETPKFVNKKNEISEPVRRDPEFVLEKISQPAVSYPDFRETKKLTEVAIKDSLGNTKKTKDKRQIFIFNPHFVKGMALSLALFISVLGGIFSIKANPQSEFVYEKRIETAFEVFESVDTTLGLVQKNISQTASVFAVKESFENTALSFYRTMRDFIRGSRLRILVWIYGDFYGSKSLTYENKNYSKNLDGMIVVPKNEKEDSEKTIERIKKSFSDEVSVIPDESGTSGVITPVFKRISDDEYLYVLVPVSD